MTSLMLFQVTQKDFASVRQELANFFCKGPGRKYFWFCRSWSLLQQICRYCTKLFVNNK